MSYVNKKEIITKFENDYRNYTNASIAFSEVQEDYKPMSWEDDCQWILDWLDKNI